MDAHLAFVSAPPDPAALEALLRDYYRNVLPVLEAAGGPRLDPGEIAAQSMTHLDESLPPDGRTLLATGADGTLLGCGMIRRIGPDAAELKRMFVRPQAQGTGLGTRIFRMRVDEARRMGCRTVYADTARGNRPMLRIYEKNGFRYIPRYEGNANPADWAPYLVYLRLDFPEEGGGSRKAAPAG